jgi:PAS domain S-box-containing protein
VDALRFRVASPRLPKWTYEPSCFAPDKDEQNMAMRDFPDPAAVGGWAGAAWIVRGLIEQLDQCVYLLDVQGRCTAANRAFRRWLGRPEMEVVGRTVFDIWPPDVAQREASQLQQVKSGAWIESEEERPRGSEMRRVRLRLAPLRDDSGGVRAVICLFREVAAAAPAEPSAVMPLSASAAARQSILVVEPNASIRLLVTTILSQQGFRVQSCANGRQALEIYRDKQDAIDLVVLELSLPGQTGLETLNELCSLNARLRILLVSGTGVPGSSWWTTTPGLRFLSKPYTPSQLVQAVRELLAAPLGKAK